MAGDKQLNFKILASVVGGQAITGLKKNVEGVGDATKGLGAQFGSLGTALKGLAGAFAIREAALFAKSLIDTGDELLALSQRTGIAVKDLSAFKAAAEQADLPFDGLVTTLKKFTANLGSVKAENNAVARVLKSLGIAALDSSGNIRSSGDVIKDLADRFANLKDGPEKAALAVKLFGKSGSEIIPFLNQGAEAISRFGLAIDDDFALRADQFNDTLATLGVQLKNVFIEGLGAALPALQEVLNAFVQVPASADGVVTTFEAIGEAVRLVAIVFDAFLSAFIQGLDTIIDVVKEVGAGVAFTFSRMADSISTTGAQLKELASLNFEGVTKLQEEYEARSKQIETEALAQRDQRQSQFFDRTLRRTQGFQERFKKLSENSFVLGQGSTEDIRKRQVESTRVSVRPQSTERAPVSGVDDTKNDRLTRELETARALRQAGLEEIEIEKLKLESYKFSGAELAKLTERKKAEIEISRATKNFTVEGAAAYRESALAVLAQKEALIELDFQQRQTFSVGIQQAARDYLERVKDVASQTKEAFTNAFRGLEDSIVNFVKTGKLNFRDFADAVISDLIRIAVRQAIIAPLLGAITGAFAGPAAGAANSAGSAAGGSVAFAANGGIMTSRGMAKLNKYARGGIANSPQLAVFGEGSTPEAYVPLPDGKRIPVAMQGSSGGGVAVNVVVNVSSSGDASSSVESQAQSGKQLGQLISSAITARLIEEKRPGGLLS